MPGTGKPTPEQMKQMFEEMQRKENEGLTPEEIEAKNKEKEMKKRQNIALIEETLEICEKGSYEKDGQTISLGLTPEQMREARVFLPDEIAELAAADAAAGAASAVAAVPNAPAAILAAATATPDTFAAAASAAAIASATAEAAAATPASTVVPVAAAAVCAFSCENKDALSLAYEKCDDPSYFVVNTSGSDSVSGGASGNVSSDGSDGVSGGTRGNVSGDGSDSVSDYSDAGGNANRILILNLANAVRPGGGVRDGMGGQEEDLCRDSTLLLSLESDAAKPYYDYNNKLDTLLGSDAVIISPNVAVFRDDAGELLDAPFTISVITCSAPNVRFGFEGKTEEEYEQMLSDRIEGMLRCAVSQGYKNIILGAFGCGAFKNDAALVSDTFLRALTGSAGRGLEHADFAVLCTPGKEYNFNEFARNFSAK